MQQRKRIRKSKSNKNGKPSTAQLVHLALSQIGKIQQSQELKYVSIMTDDTDVVYNPVIYLVSDIDQGLSDSQRVGDAVLMKDLDVRLNVLHDNSSATGIRLIFFIDKQNTITSASDLLVTTGSDEALVSHYVWDNRKQFTVLYDSVLEVDGTYKSKLCRHFNIPINKRMQLDAGTATVNTNALKCIYLSEVAPAAGNKPRLILNTRLTYLDS